MSALTWFGSVLEEAVGDAPDDASQGEQMCQMTLNAHNTRTNYLTYLEQESVILFFGSLFMGVKELTQPNTGTQREPFITF